MAASITIGLPWVTHSFNTSSHPPTHSLIVPYFTPSRMVLSTRLFFHTLSRTHLFNTILFLEHTLPNPHHFSNTPLQYHTHPHPLSNAPIQYHTPHLTHLFNIPPRRCQICCDLRKEVRVGLQLLTDPTITRRRIYLRIFESTACEGVQSTLILSSCS